MPKSLAEHGIRAEVINAGIGDTTTREGRVRLDRDVRSDPFYIDVFKVFEDYGKQSGMSINDLLLEGDGIHPNAAGLKPDFNQRI